MAPPFFVCVYWNKTDAPPFPSLDFFARRFIILREAFELIGYKYDSGS